MAGINPVAGENELSTTTTHHRAAAAGSRQERVAQWPCPASTSHRFFATAVRRTPTAKTVALWCPLLECDELHPSSEPIKNGGNEENFKMDDENDDGDTSAGV